MPLPWAINPRQIMPVRERDCERQETLISINHGLNVRPMNTFSQRHGYEVPDAEISIRHDSPEWLRELVVDLAYEAKFQPSDLRAFLCRLLLETADRNNWSEFPNIDGEVRGLLSAAPWFRVYDLIEWIFTQRHSSGSEVWNIDSNAAADRFATTLNQAFRQKGVGWQLVDGKIQVRGPEVFEEFVHQAVELTEKTGREVSRKELQEALRDLSRRPDPEVTGAIQHAMAALECIARDVSGDTKLTLGDWMKKNPLAFPQPLGSAVEKLWGYSSQYGRHVQEGKPADYDEAEMVVGIVGALSVYMLRKAGVGDKVALGNI